jgi:uncharacterized glyoxalase superfamily protein PhnB
LGNAHARYFWSDDVDALYAGLRDRGATVMQEPIDQPYELRESRVADPDGHVPALGLRYTRPDAPSASG